MNTELEPYVVKVEVSREKLKQYMKDKGIKAIKMAHELGIDSSHLSKFTRFGIGGGKLIWGKLYYYCKRKNLNFDDFIDVK